jgi:hypothetical protein
MYAPATPGMQLVQADGFQQLESPTGSNQGDDGDPFPGSKQVAELKDTGKASTSFPGSKKSGIRLSNIHKDDADSISFSIHIDEDAEAAPAAALSSATAQSAFQWGPNVEG